VFGDAQIHEMVSAILELESLPEIVQAGHPVLRAQAAEFTGQVTAAELARLVDVMRNVMLEAPGVGLAAPQIGIPLQLAVLEDLYEVSAEIAAERVREPLEFFAMINPGYQPLGTETAAFYEGCLSMSGWQAVVDRPAAITLDYVDVSGTTVSRGFNGWQARIVQHETDHLGGMLYIDKAFTRSLTSTAEYAAHWAEPGVARARAGLHF
jgi:peptide deformylase